MASDYDPSAEVAIHNALIMAIDVLEFPDILLAGRSNVNDGSVLIGEDQVTRTSRPAAIIACPSDEVFEPSRSCSTVSTRTRWSWDVRVQFNRNVLTDRALKRLAKEPILVTAGTERLILRLTRVEHTFRPLADPEQGTSLRLKFESISNR